MSDYACERCTREIGVDYFSWEHCNKHGLGVVLCRLCADDLDRKTEDEALRSLRAHRAFRNSPTSIEDELAETKRLLECSRARVKELEDELANTVKAARDELQALHHEFRRTRNEDLL